MILRFFGLVWACLLVVLATGCCTDSIYRGGCFDHTPVAAPCSDCGGGGCDSCAGGVGQPGLLSYVKKALTCGSGCGEFYLHPWINEAPKDCDPCDNCGNWVGPQGCDSCGNHGRHGPWLGHLWGYRTNGGGEHYVDESYADAAYDDDDVDAGIVASAPGEYEGAIRDVQVFGGTVDGSQKEGEGGTKTIYNRMTRSRKTVSRYRPTPRR